MVFPATCSSTETHSWFRHLALCAFICCCLLQHSCTVNVEKPVVFPVNLYIFCILFIICVLLFFHVLCVHALQSVVATAFRFLEFWAMSSVSRRLKSCVPVLVPQSQGLTVLFLKCLLVEVHLLLWVLFSSILMWTHLHGSFSVLVCGTLASQDYQGPAPVCVCLSSPMLAESIMIIMLGFQEVTQPAVQASKKRFLLGNFDIRHFLVSQKHRTCQHSRQSLPRFRES